VKGSFTGALRDNPGRVAACESGTLFLDEIGDLPLSIQPKHLRFIQDREYERLGDQRTRRVDARIITATNRDLAKVVKERRFREDLYYRLNVIQIDLPALADRPLLSLASAERASGIAGPGTAFKSFCSCFDPLTAPKAKWRRLASSAGRLGTVSGARKRFLQGKLRMS